jgi:hypothetical protein
MIIPLEFGFGIRAEDKNFLNFIDLWFLADFVLMFFTSFRNNLGIEIFDLRLISHNYAKSMRFYIDFFSQLGGSLISNLNEDLRFFGLLKILRVFRLSLIIQRLNVESSTKTFFNLVKLIIYLIVWLQFMTCFFYSTTLKNWGKIDQFGGSRTWNPPLDFINFPDSMLFKEEYDFFSRYVLCFYYALLILGSNEIAPVNENEMLVLVIFLIISLFVGVFLLSDVAVLIGDFGKADLAY